MKAETKIELLVTTVLGRFDEMQVSRGWSARIPKRPWKQTHQKPGPGLWLAWPSLAFQRSPRLTPPAFLRWLSSDSLRLRNLTLFTSRLLCYVTPFGSPIFFFSLILILKMLCGAFPRIQPPNYSRLSTIFCSWPLQSSLDDKRIPL